MGWKGEEGEGQGKTREERSTCSSLNRKKLCHYLHKTGKCYALSSLRGKSTAISPTLVCHFTYTNLWKTTPWSGANASEPGFWRFWRSGETRWSPGQQSLTLDAESR